MQNKVNVASHYRDYQDPENDYGKGSFVVPWWFDIGVIDSEPTELTAGILHGNRGCTPREPNGVDMLGQILLHATHVTVAGLCLAAGLIILEQQVTKRTSLLRRDISSVSAVLNLIAQLAWETLPVHIPRAVL